MPRPSTSPLFDPLLRTRASKPPSQKAINRRKSLAAPGAYPDLLPSDPAIPIVLYPSTSCSSNGWTLLAPWKTIQPIWYGLMYYPLSTGGQPRFGGLNEQRQLAFEAGRPWYPADAPGTEAGWSWEIIERKKRLEEWTRRPKGKRIAWEKVEANVDGKGGRGEVGEGWACGWEMLLESDGLVTTNLSEQNGEDAELPAQPVTTADGPKDSYKQAPSTTTPQVPKGNSEQAPSTTTAIEQKNPQTSSTTTTTKSKNEEALPKPKALQQLSRGQAEVFLRSPDRSQSPAAPAPNLTGKLMTVKLTLLTRGVPQTCARIYRVPGQTSPSASLRNQWLNLLPEKGQQKKKDKSALPPRLRDGASEEEVQRHIAQELIKGDDTARGDSHPACPPQADLIGFVTAGNYNLAEGKGTGIGSIALWKSGDMSVAGRESRLCVVRNAGEGMGRLARWDIV